MDADGTNVQRLPDNEGCTLSDFNAALSPDGKKIVLDSTREAASVSPGSLFVMASDGTEPTFLTRGSSATWSSDSRYVAFHASSGSDPTPIRNQPDSPTKDSDIFVANVLEQRGDVPNHIFRSRFNDLSPERSLSVSLRK
jgi:Tol biopolymer transport system component